MKQYGVFTEIQGTVIR